MSSKLDRRESKSVDRQKEDEKLWENLKIDFSLEAQSFSDNKIYGIIKIKPKAARELIEHFSLVYNKDRTRFDPKFRHISAYGFDPTKRDFQIYIEAIPKNQGLKIKESKPYTFSIVRQSFSLAPTLTFDYSSWTEKDKQSDLIIKWCHIGDQTAQKYVVSLDKKEIYFIREPSKKGTFEVRVRHLKPDKELTRHTIQIIAKLNNDKETCISDFIEFTIPNKKNEQNTEVINVFNSSDDPDNDEDDDDSQDNTMENDEKQKTKTSSTVENHPPQTTTSSTEENHPPQTKTSSIEENHPPQTKKHDEISATRSCSCSRPHDSFPGIDHYFKIDNHQPSPTSVIKKTSTDDHAKPSTKIKRITHTDDDESEKEYDDDNGVVTNDTPANS